jgi:uncharacterized membrane protein YvlD (DUF360 family)
MTPEGLRADPVVLVAHYNGAYALRMVVLGGIAGAIAGFLLSLLITEVLIGNPPNQTGFDWAFWTDILLTIIGAVFGSVLGRRFRSGQTA